MKKQVCVFLSVAFFCAALVGADNPKIPAAQPDVLQWNSKTLYAGIIIGALGMAGIFLLHKLLSKPVQPIPVTIEHKCDCKNHHTNRSVAPRNYEPLGRDPHYRSSSFYQSGVNKRQNNSNSKYEDSDDDQRE